MASRVGFSHMVSIERYTILNYVRVSLPQNFTVDLR
jgi:hypothetical protein